ncbi:MAG: transglycosylase domain-containing protein [Pseudanabaena sp. ELA607]
MSSVPPPSPQNPHSPQPSPQAQAKSPAAKKAQPKSQLFTQMTEQVMQGILRLKPNAQVPQVEIKVGDKGQPARHHLSGGDIFTLGRSSQCNILLPTGIASQVHAEIIRDQSQKKIRFILKDKDSTNGTYRGKQRIKSVPLRHNMRLTFGPPELENSAIIRFIDPPPWYIRTAQYTAIGVGSALTLLIAALLMEVGRVPDVKPLPREKAGPIEILAGDNKTVLNPDTKDTGAPQDLPNLQDFGPYLPSAVIASEDSSFYSPFNFGVDPWGILRAVVTNIRSREAREGASTITQQLARNAFGQEKGYVGKDENLSRKWREAAAAIKIRANYSKEEILAMYLNRVYLGRGIYGFENAAKLYFGKSAKDLDLSEAATLAGILPSPNTINPFKNKNLSIEYRDRVLDRMAQLGMVSDKDADRARRSILKLNESARNQVQSDIAPYFYSYVNTELEDLLGEKFLREGNLIVETGLDVSMQKAADNTLREAVRRDGATYSFTQGAIVSLDSSDGSILAMTGGVDYKKSQFNRAVQARRQPGSTFKLFSYGAALEQGTSPNTTFSCAGISGVAGCHNGASGSASMYVGFALSENVVAIRVAQAAGLDNVAKFAEKLGITAKLDRSNNMVLGGNEVSVLEMAGAYATVFNQGIYNKPHAIRRILDNNDCTNRKDRANTCRVIFDARRDVPGKPQIEARVVSDLQDLMRGVVTNGTGRAARISQAVVMGKTGTTDQARDLWFIGGAVTSPSPITTAIWLGNDEGVTENGSGAVAAGVWGDYMRVAIR